eukprot:1107093-Prymnesium_polylepis.1
MRTREVRSTGVVRCTHVPSIVSCDIEAEAIGREGGLEISSHAREHLDRVVTCRAADLGDDAPLCLAHGLHGGGGGGAGPPGGGSQNFRSAAAVAAPRDVVHVLTLFGSPSEHGACE